MKIQSCLTLDLEIVTELRARNINMSQTVNDLLKQHLGILQEDDGKQDIHDKLLVSKARTMSLEREINAIKTKKNKNRKIFYQD